MKLIHTADLHLDGALGGFSKKEASELRRKGFLTLRNIAKYAEQNEISHILIAGDLFDTAAPSIRARDAVLSVFTEYSGISFYLISGNHDDVFPSELAQRLPDNVFLFGKGFTSRSIDENIELWATSDEIPEIKGLNLKKEKRNIVMIHSGPSSSSGRYSVDIGELDEIPVDYLALGHYHSFDCGRCGRGEWVMCGTPMPRGFDETGEKGFVEVEIDDKGVSYRFVPLESSRFFTEEYSFNGEEIDYGAIAEFIRQKGIGKNDFLRLTLTGETSTLHIDEAFTAERLSDCCGFISVFDKTGIKQEAFSSISLYAEFKSLVEADSELSEDDKNEILRYGYAALRGEEPDTL